jgi:hypothetical protein
MKVLLKRFADDRKGDIEGKTVVITMIVLVAIPVLALVGSAIVSKLQQFVAALGG